MTVLNETFVRIIEAIFKSFFIDEPYRKRVKNVINRLSRRRVDERTNRKVARCFVSEDRETGAIT